MERQVGTIVLDAAGNGIPAIRIAFEFAQAGNGPWYVLVPGLGNDRTLFEELIDELALRGARACAIDPPGFGESSHIGDDMPYSLDLCRMAVASVIASFGITRPVLVLHSAAVGYVEPDLASQSPSIVLLEANLVAEDAAWSEEITGIADEKEFDRYCQRLTRHGERIVQGAVHRRLDANALQRIGGCYRRMDRRAFRQIAQENLERTKSGAYLEDLAALAECGVAVHYVRGGRSADWHGQTHLRAAGIALHQLDGAGHFPMVDAPARLADMMVAWQAH